MNLVEYMSRGVENIIQNALKSSLKNPKESAFLLKYFLAAKAAEKVRKEYECAGEHIPPFLIASIASSCNLFCKGCYARANHSCGEGKAEELSAQRWGELFQEAQELGVSFILLAGGEPLMRRDVLEKATECSKIIFPVFTNGTLIHSTYLPLFDQHRNLVPVLSIEGDEQQTDARRGTGVYRELSRAMSELNQQGILYGASVTVTTENLETVTSEEFIRNLWDNGCKLVIFVEYVPADPNTLSLAPGDEERKTLEARQAQLRNLFENMILLSFPGDEKYTGGCLAAGRGFFHISANGSAEPCPFSPFSDTNLREDGLLKALQSPLFRRLSDEGLLSEDHDGGCVLFQKQAQVMRLL